MGNFESKIETHQSLKAYFHKELLLAAKSQSIETEEHTLYYLGNLLNQFSETNSLFEATDEGLMFKPLALIFADANAAPSLHMRYQQLRRLGDIALFVAGVLPHSLSKKLVNIDYYIGMGSSAYACLARIAEGSTRLAAFKIIHEELARNFEQFVELLNEVSEHAHFSSDQHLLELYEMWIRTGSERIKERLSEAGIIPIANQLSVH